MKASLILVGCVLLAARGRAQGTAAVLPSTPPERVLATDPVSALTSGRWGLALAAYAGYDSIRHDSGAPGSSATNLLQQSGQQNGLTARLAVSRKRRRSELTLGGESTAMQYGFAGSTLVDVTATSRQSTTVGRKTVLTASQRLGYAPYQTLGLFPGFGVSEASDVSSSNAPSFQQGAGGGSVVRYDLGASAATPLSARNMLEIDYQRTATLASAALTDTTYQETGVRILRQRTRVLGYHFGYAYAESSNNGLHHFRIGLDGRKPLSRSRRTIFSFATDSTLVRRPVTSRAPRSEFRVLGSADLDQYIGRTWRARATYRRDVALIEGYASPIFRESIVSGLAGSFGRRTTAGLNGAYVLAELPDQTSDTRDRALTGTAWARVAVSRRLSVFGEYIFYAHHADAAAAAVGLPPQFTRNTVHVGMAFNQAPVH